MAQEELSPNSDWILVEKEGNDFEKLETNFDNLQKEFVEEKKKIASLKRKNNLLESELKEMYKKIQKINSDHKKEIEEIKQNFQKLVDENNVCLEKKDDKINSLGEEMKKTNGLFEKKFDDLIKLNNLICNKYANFVKIENKWSEIDKGFKCCVNNCINTDKPIGNCIEGNGYINVINDEDIKYINRLEGKGVSDKFVFVYAENLFKKQQNSFYSLYYFEIKSKFDGEFNKDKNLMRISLLNFTTNKVIWYCAEYSSIVNERIERFILSTNFNNDDIFGCGLVYPPTNKLNEEFPYVFFTQNGKQISKGLFLYGNSDSYKPFVFLKCCSIEANFGNDLESKPFNYDISKHSILKEFY